MKIQYLRSLIVVISLMLMSGCVGYAPPQPYPHYGGPVAAPYIPPRVEAYGGYNHGPSHPNFGGPGREIRDYGSYRRHDRD